MADLRMNKARLVEEIRALREEVRLNRERLRDSMIQSGIVESSMDAVIIVDGDQNIVQFNAAAEQIFGYSPAEVRGKPIHMLLPERFRAAIANTSGIILRRALHPARCIRFAP